MNTKTILAILLAAASAAGSVQAEPLTREQVRAEVLAARAAGTLTSGGEGYQAQLFDTASTLTRDAVRAQLLAARAAGTVHEGEVYPGPAALDSSAMALTRTQVKSELAAARAAGTQHAGEAYPGPLASGG